MKDDRCSAHENNPSDIKRDGKSPPEIGIDEIQK